MEAIAYITCIRFSLQLLIGEAAFLIGRPHRPFFKIRLIGALFVYFFAASLYFLLLKQVPWNNPIVQVFFFMGLFILTLLVVAFCYDLPLLEIVFVGTGGYATEHIAFAIARIFQYITGWTVERIGVVQEYLIFRLFIYIVVAAVVYFGIVRKNREKEEFKEKDVRMVELALMILLSAIVLSSFYTFSGDGSVLGHIICPMYSMLCCFLVIMIEYYVFRENKLSRDNEMIEQLLQMANAQQKSSKEAIDIINVKCHDLKYQMKELEKLNSDEERSEYIEEMKKAISIYDATYHTGCEALDYILREKTLLSDEHHIVFSCMADGEALSFMDKTDLYALFGNALDNALERTVQEREERRIISLRVSRRGQMVLIHLENACSETPDFQEELPVTTKADKNYHGFGVRSMRYIVRKYDGEMLMRTQDEKFILDIAFPQRSGLRISA
jgi:hypothetical protein